MTSKEPHQIPDLRALPQGEYIFDSHPEPKSLPSQEERQTFADSPRAQARAERTARNSDGQDIIDEMTALKLLHRFPVDKHRSTWLVNYETSKNSPLSLPSGKYTLLTVPAEDQGIISVATRLCALEPHASVLTIEALSEYGNRHQIWAEPISGGTLKNLLTARQKLSLAETAWIAQKLAEGLEFYHRNDMSFSKLSASQCAFNKEASALLLPADRDLRGLPGTEQEQAQQDNIRDFASLLWLCITGAEAPEDQYRLPLSSLMPSISKGTSQLFEEALSPNAEPPNSYELALALTQEAEPQVPALYEAAPEATRTDLPPLASIQTRQRAAQETNKKPGILRQRPITISAQNIGRQKECKNLKGLVKPTSNNKQKLIFSAALVLLLTVGTAVIWTAIQEKDRQLTAKSTSQDNPVDLQAVITSAQNSVSPGDKSTLNSSQQATVNSQKSNSKAQLIVQEAISRRNEVYAQGQAEAVTSYALAGSSLAINDQKRIRAKGAINQGKLSLEKIVNETGDDNTYQITALLKTPQNSAENQTDPSIYYQDGFAYQEVVLTFEKVGDQWLLSQSRPVSAEKSK